MYDVVYGQEKGYLLSLATLRFALGQISEGGKSWKILEVVLTGDSPCVRVGQKDDSYMLRLNDLIYSIPIEVSHGDLETEANILVSLHGFTLETVQAGRYVTASRIVEDFIEDFESFWNPIAALLNIYAEDFLNELQSGSIY